MTGPSFTPDHFLHCPRQPVIRTPQYILLNGSASSFHCDSTVPPKQETRYLVSARFPQMSGSYQVFLGTGSNHNLRFLQGGSISFLPRCESKGIFFLPIKENTPHTPRTAVCYSPRASDTFQRACAPVTRLLPPRSSCHFHLLLRGFHP